MDLVDLLRLSSRNGDEQRQRVRKCRAAKLARSGQASQTALQCKPEPQPESVSQHVAEVWNDAVATRRKELLDDQGNLKDLAPGTDSRTWATEAMLRVVFSQAGCTFDFTDTAEVFQRRSAAHALSSLRVIGDALLAAQRAGLQELHQGDELPWRSAIDQRQTLTMVKVSVSEALIGAAPHCLPPSKWPFANQCCPRQPKS